MDKKLKKVITKAKSKMLPEKNKLKKEQITDNESKKLIQEENQKPAKKNHKSKVSSKKNSMDNKETTSNSNNNNITDSSEVLMDKKKIIKNEVNSKKINLDTKHSKNPEERIEKNINLSNKDYNINPFLINAKSNNITKISYSYNNQEIEIEKDNKENKNIPKKEEIKINNIENKNILKKEEINNMSGENNNVNLKNINNNSNIRENYNQENFREMEICFEKKRLTSIEVKDKDKNIMYKNRFLTKINKNRNNSKEKKCEASFGSIIHQKKLKLFSFSNGEKNQINTIDLKESAMLSISTKNIIHENSKNENNLLVEIKDDLNKDTPQIIIHDSGKKRNSVEKKNSTLTLKKLNQKNIDDNSNSITNQDNSNTNTNKDNKETIKLETKINKNREKLFNSKGKIKNNAKAQNQNTLQLIFPQKKNNNQYNIRNHENRKYANTNVVQKKNNNNSKIIINKKNIFKSSKYDNYSSNLTFNSSKNKNKLIISNSNLSKNKIEEIKEIKSQINNNEKDKAINFKKTISPTKINIDLELSNSKNNQEVLSEKPYLLSSERFSDLNKDSYVYSILKKYNKKDEKFKNINKSPQIMRQKNTKILRTKTEFRENDNSNTMSGEINENIDNRMTTNLEINNSKEIKKGKIIKNKKEINNEEIFMPLSTLDNELFKKNTVKKLIKNNQYKALLSEMQTFSVKKNKKKEEEKTKGKDVIKRKTKFRFSERRSSHKNGPTRKLTESIENYYDFYKKTFKDNNNLEQKFTFRPKSKRYKFYKNLDEDYESSKILNKKISTISFQSNQKQTLNNEFNIEDIKNEQNALSSSFIESKLYDNNLENENDNKNFILDLNHFIPIDEKKLINTFARPIFGDDNYTKQKK